MIDEFHGKFEIYGEGSENISKKEVISALSAEPDNYKKDMKSEYIYECFGDLVFYFDRIQSFIEVGILQYDDVKQPFDYYINLMKEDKETYIKYINNIGTNLKSVEFMKRYF